MADGDLSSVNPSLLQLCGDAEKWKQQRREAYLRKIQQGERGDNQAGRYLPKDLGDDEERIPQQQQPRQAQQPPPPSNEERQVLQQLLSQKRQRDEQTAGTAQSDTMSLKDKLMQKFGKQ